MKRTIVMVIAFAICLSMVISSPLGAAASKSKVLPVRSTWDLDMINADSVTQTGKGVYIAVLDTGLTPNWKDYFPQDKILTDLGKGFYEDITWDSKTRTFTETGTVHQTTYIGSTGSTHGTHVTSTIIGYDYYSPSDAAQGYPLTPLHIQGVASDAKIIPVKVLADYHIGKSQTDSVNYPEQNFVMGTDRAVAAGIDYATDLCIAGYKPMIITMSLGGGAPATVMENAIDRAIANGVIVVASAGNEGVLGMGWPGAYPQVISVGASGWKYEWYAPELTPPPLRYRLWWLQDSTYGFNDVPETGAVSQVYISEFSSRQLAGQQLDVVAPGSWVRGPYPGDPGYSHLPWWSEGKPKAAIGSGTFYYLGGTSMAAPHVTGVIALMLEKDSSLIQSQVEGILTGTALPIPDGSMTVWDLSPVQGWYTYTWGSDATGAGLVQADAAIAAI
jgi:subtilisin family serine protease